MVFGFQSDMVGLNRTWRMDCCRLFERCLQEALVLFMWVGGSVRADNMIARQTQK